MREVSGFSRNETYRVQPGNVRLYRWLLTIGLFPAKTYSIGPIAVPDLYFRDFVRGHLDGDGCVSVYRDAYNTRINPSYIYTRLLIRFISVSQLHINWLRASLVRLAGVRGDLFLGKPRTDKGVGMWQLKFMKKESIKLISWIYYSPNIICLARKREKAFSVLKDFSATTRKKYTRQFAE